MAADKLLKPAEVAEEFDVAEGTLRNWRHLKTGPAYVKVGRGVRYRRRVVEAYLNARTVATTT